MNSFEKIQELCQPLLKISNQIQIDHFFDNYDNDHILYVSNFELEKIGQKDWNNLKYSIYTSFTEDYPSHSVLILINESSEEETLKLIDTYSNPNFVLIDGWQVSQPQGFQEYIFEKVNLYDAVPHSDLEHAIFDSSPKMILEEQRYTIENLVADDVSSDGNLDILIPAKAA